MRIGLKFSAHKEIKLEKWKSFKELLKIFLYSTDELKHKDTKKTDKEGKCSKNVPQRDATWN